MKDLKAAFFQEYSSFFDDDEDFEPSELENFCLDKIAPKHKADITFPSDEFSDAELLASENFENLFSVENDLKSIFNFFEN